VVEALASTPGTAHPWAEQCLWVGSCQLVGDASAACKADECVCSHERYDAVADRCQSVHPMGQPISHSEQDEQPSDAVGKGQGGVAEQAVDQLSPSSARQPNDPCIRCKPRGGYQVRPSGPAPPKPTQMTPRQDIPAGRRGHQQLRQIVHPMQYAAQRAAWPRLWEELDELVRLVDRDDRHGATSPRLFDPPT